MTLSRLFDFIFNVSTDPALMEAAAPDPTVGLVSIAKYCNC